MKMRIFTLLTFIVIVSKSLLAQDTIPNAGFENWTHNAVPSYDDPNGWTTLNSLTGILNVFTAYKEATIVHGGSYSLKLVTKSAAGQTAPGLVTNGTINSGNSTITDGKPINSRPSSLDGWFQYVPVGGDSAQMSITLTKWDAVGDSQILVGVGNVFSGSKDTVWTPFTASVNYFSNVTPDTVLLLFFSSAAVTPQINSTLWLDDLSYSFPSGINEKGLVQVRVYPNPVNDIEYFSIDNTLELKNPVIQFYNVDGQKVKEVKEIGSHSFSVDTKNLAVGYYTYQLLNDGKLAGTGKIVVQR